jgi:hypothetical protein
VKSLSLLALTSVQTIEHSLALQHSYDLLSKVRPVEEMILIAPPGSEVSEDYQGRLIPLPFAIDIWSYGYMQVRLLARYVRTDFMLNIQADGFVVNPELWSEDFLSADYCGAPWPHGLTLTSRVGNSGFSLRSRRFMELSAIGPAYECGTGDDVYWAHTAHQYFLDHGMKFAPLNIAGVFALENDCEDLPGRTLENVFGQHGRLRVGAKKEGE